jgi:hypothetical protein
MNTLNRVLVVLAAILAIPVCMTIFIVPIPLLQVAGDALTALAASLGDIAWYVRLPTGIFLAVASLVICGFFLVMQFRRPKEQTVRLDKIGGGQVEVSLKTITDRVSYDVDQLPGVLKTRPKASARRGGVVIELDVNIAGDIEVPSRAAQIVEVVRRAVEERVGIKLAQPPRVKVQATPSPDNQLPRPVRPMQPEPPSEISERPMVVEDPMMGQDTLGDDPLDQALELPESPE